jgi:hypothetical protein
MGTYWAILLDRVKYLYDKGIRGMEIESWHEPNGKRKVYWEAWGIDGLPADWKELGLEKNLDELAYKLTQEHDGFIRLYIYPRGYRIERREWGQDWERKEVLEDYGTSFREPVQPRPLLSGRFSWGRSLRERLQYLVSSYRTWYHHNAPKEWRETHSPEPTLENILEWGRAMEEFGILEEPLVPKLLQEILGKGR